jgi:hypothetical protein
MTLTTDLNVRLSPFELIQELAEEPELRNQLPLLFEEQAVRKCPKFYLTGEQVGEQALMRIVIEDPTVVPGGISVKFRLTGIMHQESGEMVPQNRSQRGMGLGQGQAWMKGFKSNPGIILTPQHLSPEGYGALEEYANFYASVGRDAFYNEHSGNRLFLAALDPSAQFQFYIQVRTNPTNGGYALGITGESFKIGSFGILGTGVTQATELEEYVEIVPVEAVDTRKATVKAR